MSLTSASAAAGACSGSIVNLTSAACTVPPLRGGRLDCRRVGLHGDAEIIVSRTPMSCAHRAPQAPSGRQIGLPVPDAGCGGVSRVFGEVARLPAECPLDSVGHVGVAAVEDLAEQ